LGEIKVGGGRLYDGRSISNEAWKGVRALNLQRSMEGSSTTTHIGTLAGPDKTRSHPLARLAPNSSGHTLTALPYTMLAHDPGLNHSDRLPTKTKTKMPPKIYLKVKTLAAKSHPYSLPKMPTSLEHY